MNCTVDLQQDKTFACPCHKSSFDSEGKVLLGPALRPMDTLEYRVSEGVLSVQYQNFKKNLPTKEINK
jgi:Rieske Fe-S protein